ncbi:MAG: single-stranded-DNA-specific exonuclease RecJ [Chloroflexi bacterium]|nr:single-stranded-DNA-specific exonuclease RecJ [Chloroflexota bacterium]MCY3583772.1 single-stranded-DNA-specific exonuclease RecJ [Chloroflexota bacterium]MXX50674.1 single-stranded-DNA-specific exonuclease RecJ [Chloroflexota bacterium]MXX83008.1 single-stranded-DNA-specific exonuclease RecJ [Chloroflexota bacterium]MYA94181.1 single-stranded-DNA-specific exonuclease RecJ [Chloroflexota bacterium]
MRHSSRVWQLPPQDDLPSALHSTVGGHPIVARRLARMGISDPTAARQFLDSAQYSPTPASALPDIEVAVARLRQAIRQAERILVWGDFDVDGQTASALLYASLRELGARVTVHLPNRFREGHGIHLATLQRHLQDGFDLLLTCDTGVDAHQAVALAAERGVDTIITDHHALPERLPNALAVVNPRRLPEGHPLRDLPGVGVAYKLIQMLEPAIAAAHLDLVALGMVADVMPLLGENRYLLQLGLEQLRYSPRVGIRAILQRAQIDAAALNEGHIGFAIAPRLNALGRVGDANPAVELLTTDNYDRALSLAGNLEEANSRRRFLSNQVYAAAIHQVEAEPHLLDYAALVLQHHEWHSGVIGIVASRLVEEFALPTVLLSAPGEELARGSARSVAGLDIMAALRQTQGLLHSYGGHSMAAGMSLRADSISDFRRALSRAVRDMGGAPAAPPLTIAADLSLPELSSELTDEIERLAPFGQGNPPLILLTRGLSLASQRGLGRRGDHRQVIVADQADNRQRVIWWRGAGKSLPKGVFDLAYTLRASHFRGQRENLVEWLAWRENPGAAVELPSAAPKLLSIDYTSSANALDDLTQARQQFPAAQVWAEGAQMPDCVSRLQLAPGETLIVWTIPASRLIWQAALETVNPARLIAFAVRPAWWQPNAFLTRLYGMAKYAVAQRDGAADVPALAAALGDRALAVQAGLHLLRARGLLEVEAADGQLRLWLTQASPDAKRCDKWRARLELILRETRAYRDYWRLHALAELA